MWLTLLGVFFVLGCIQENLTINAATHNMEDFYSEDADARGRYIRSPLQPKWKELQNPAYIVQMGSGIPTWQGQEIRAGWPDGVPEGQSLSLFTLSPTEQTVANVFAFGCLFAFLWQYKQAATLMGLLLLIAIPRADAQEFPDEEMRTMLLQRAQQRECSENCTTIPLMAISIKERELTIEAELHAVVDNYVFVPGPTDGWRPTSLSLDGTPWSSIRQMDDGFIAVRIPKGVWTLQITGPIENILRLQFKQPPKRLDFSSEEWVIDGLNDNGTTTGAILIRKKDREQEEIGGKPLFRLTRHLHLDMDWKIENTLQRQGSNQQPLAFNLAVLDGEKAITGGFTQEGNQLSVNVNAEQQQVKWTSRLERQNTLQLRASESPVFSEEWIVSCGRQYDCAFDGISPLKHTNEQEWEPRWRPLPKEELTIEIQQRTPTDGNTHRIEAINIEHNLGTSQHTTFLSFDIEASQNGRIDLDIPASALLQSFEINERPFPFSQAGQVIIPFELGMQQVRLAWKTPASSTIQRLPSIEFPDQITNVNVKVSSPKGSTVWYATDFWWRASGNAILLPFALVLALILAREASSKLLFWHWTILTLGALQFGLVFGIIITSLMWAKQSAQDISANTRWVLDAAFYGTLAVALLWLFTENFTPLLAFSKEQLRWYTDIHNGPTPQVAVLTLPKWISEGMLVSWLLFVFYQGYAMKKRPEI